LHKIIAFFLFFDKGCPNTAILKKIKFAPFSFCTMLTKSGIRPIVKKETMQNAWRNYHSKKESEAAAWKCRYGTIKGGLRFFKAITAKMDRRAARALYYK
jgi:hypothetical protein